MTAMAETTDPGAARARDRGRLRVVVLGYLVRGPLGGRAWHVLQYVLGLHKMGHEVYFLEDSDDQPWACYDPARNVTDGDPSYGLGFVSRAFADLGLGERWAYHDALTGRWHGLAEDRVREICRTADLLINVGGATPLRPWSREVEVRAYVDTDPVFTQVANLTDEARRARVAGHTVFFTYGRNIGRPDCTIPDDGFPWRPTVPPVVLEAWPVTPGPVGGSFTSVLKWERGETPEWEGRKYGVKSASFGPFMDLPTRTEAVLELAVGTPYTPRDELIRRGWRLRDPLRVTADLWSYQRFIRESKAEFAVAKHGYVSSRGGWFSERSANYLASGRPVIAQETGFSDWLPAEGGVIAFATPDEALRAIQDVTESYDSHCRLARSLAEAHFESGLVLGRLLAAALDGAAMEAARDG